MSFSYKKFIVRAAILFLNLKDVSNPKKVTSYMFIEKGKAECKRIFNLPSKKLKSLWRYYILSSSTDETESLQ